MCWCFKKCVSMVIGADHRHCSFSSLCHISTGWPFARLMQQQNHLTHTGPVGKGKVSDCAVLPPIVNLCVLGHEFDIVYTLARVGGCVGVSWEQGS